MKRVLLLVAAAIAAFVLMGTSPLTIPGGGHVNTHIAGGDFPGGG